MFTLLVNRNDRGGMIQGIVHCTKKFSSQQFRRKERIFSFQFSPFTILSDS